MKRVYKRILSVVLALTVAVGSVCWQPPKAKAVVIDATAAFGAAAATAAVNGTTATTLFTGMGTSAATSSVIGLMDTYAAATGVAASGTALASTIATGILVAGGTLLVGAAAAALIGGFIDWMREQEGVEPGGEALTFGEMTGFYAYNGIKLPGLPSYDVGAYPYAYIRNVEGKGKQYILYVSVTAPVLKQSLDTFYISSGGFATYKFSDGSSTWVYDYTSSQSVYCGEFYEGQWSNTNIMEMDSRDNLTSILAMQSSVPIPFYEEGTEFSVQPKPEFQEIPNEIPESQVLSIDTGLSALPQDDPQAIADAIMQSAIDGALDPSVSVVTDPTVTPDPDPGTDPEPGGAETTSWLSRILESIKSLPQKIAEAISSIFVPSPDFFPTAISNLRDAYSDRMGLLTYPISVLFDFLDRILNLNNQQPILRWDNIYLPWYSGRPVVAAGQYNLNDTLSTSAGRQVHEIYLVVVDAIMILAFLDLCRRKYQKIIHN